MDNIARDIQTQIELTLFHKSSLRAHSIDQLTILYTVFIPTGAGSCIKLPKLVADKIACVNSKYDDNKCLICAGQYGVFGSDKMNHT